MNNDLGKNESTVDQDLSGFSGGGDDEEDATSTQANDDSGGQQVAEVHQELLAKRETYAVNFLKIVTILVLLAAAGAIAAAVYLYTHNTEVNEFHATFDDYSEKIVTTVQAEVQHKLESVGAIALQLQAYAINMNLTWPFVTMPFFEETIMATKSLTDSYGVMMFPIVEYEEREAWENYSILHRDWINASYTAQQRTYGSDGFTSEFGEVEYPVDYFDLLWGPDYVAEYNPDFSYGISSKIFKTRHEDDPENFNPAIDDTQGPYYPQWQAAPFDWYYQSTVNTNYAHYPDFLEQTKIVQATQTAVFGEAWTDSSTPGFISTMLYPIFDQFYDGEVVGFVAIDLFWQAFLKRLLPRSEGIYVVISNTCNQTFTYQLFGDETEFVGEGDLHEPKFDYLGQSFLFGAPFMEPITSDSYTGRPLYGDFCPYTFGIFPSQAMESAYVTNQPVIYAVVACVILIFTAIVFLTYDFLVERRQKLVMNKATTADNLVSSLFPTDVKNRLYLEDPSKASKVSSSAPKEFMGVVNPNSVEDPSPIADLYPDCTVMFGDLVGFTSWSSDRKPADVFLLLETLYGRFDKIAKKRGVFKVETIGDCYVAVTGIPRPQERHAVIMTRFAQECQEAMHEERIKLAESLGVATLDLALRIGLHSGPVVAGVLRGEKARFQLFGDTMNTASRIESNGQANRILVSEATAHLLQDAGKPHWLMARGKVSAKGKGELVTYWVKTKTALTSVTHSSNSGLTSDEDTTRGGDDLFLSFSPKKVSPTASPSTDPGALIKTELGRGIPGVPITLSEECAHPDDEESQKSREQQSRKNTDPEELSKKEPDLEELSKRFVQERVTVHHEPEKLQKETNETELGELAKRLSDRLPKTTKQPDFFL